MEVDSGIVTVLHLLGLERKLTFYIQSPNRHYVNLGIGQALMFMLYCSAKERFA